MDFVCIKLFQGGQKGVQGSAGGGKGPLTEGFSPGHGDGHMQWHQALLSECRAPVE